MITPANAKAVSLRISVTDRCQFRCRHCMPPQGIALARHEDVLRFEEILEFAGIVQRRFGLAKARVTGGEPLVRRGVTELVRGLAGLGIPDVALTTNAVRLPEMAADLRRAGLQRINISLHSLDPATYCELTGGGDLAQALAGIDAARQAGLDPVKLNVVVLRGVNDGEAEAMVRFALERGCVVRFLELMPLGAAQARHKEWFVPSAEVRRRLAETFDLEPLPPEAASSSRGFLADDRAGRRGVIGFISPCTEPFCGPCRRLRLTATGTLIGCLAQEEGRDVRTLLRQRRPDAEVRLAEEVEAALRVKCGVRWFADRRFMVRIGG